MLLIKNRPLKASEVSYLNSKQAEIDAVNGYSQQVSKGKDLWESKSAIRFKEIRSVLTSMCVGIRRCSYCEDSVADEVEHIKPKDLYPEVVFDWSNYLYACGNCNGPKNNNYAVINQAGGIVDVTRARGTVVSPPVNGLDAFINPRAEDPLNFIKLDLSTMRFVPKRRISDVDRLRVSYTIKTLGLNSRDFLVESRKVAYSSYIDAVNCYKADKASGMTDAQLRLKKSKILKMPHQTVWEEIKAQCITYRPLNGLFTTVPELLI
ncbi:hypothetical protein ACUVJH_15595 [Aeromonas veronii]|uniref:hypothetical protein n=1 Tax=Aeromonas veronii TaxID=654 RepID=UPI00405570E2